jgi:hypothetical protein
VISVAAVVEAAIRNVDRRLDKRDARRDHVDQAYEEACEAREALNAHMGRLQRRREEAA